MASRAEINAALYAQPSGGAVADGLTRGRRSRVQPPDEAEFLDIEPPPEDRGLPFPVDALPIALSTFALETARSLEVEPEMVIVPALVTAGAAIGDSRCLVLKSGYPESAMLWAAVVARPGSVKTAAMAAAAAPLMTHERQLHAENELLWRDYETDRADGKRAPEPKSRRQIVSDITLEELAYILRDNPRGVVLLTDEVASWMRGMNQYKSKGADRSHWLSIWSSVQITVDRRGTHGRPLRAWHPFVSLVGGIQPDLLRELRPENAADDGMIDRILFAWPAQRVRRWTEATVGERIKRQYGDIVAGLLGLRMRKDELDFDQPEPVFLSEAARYSWIDLYNRHHAEMAGAEFEPRLHGAYAKLDAYAARFTLILHLMKVAAEETDAVQVEVDTVESAWRIADYFKAGARRVYGQMEMTLADRSVQNAVEWMARHETSELSAHDCISAHLAKTADDVRLLFKSLTGRGYGVWTEAPSAHGGKQRLVFRRGENEWQEK